MSALAGCGDSACLVAPGPARGMSTNGECQCDERTLRLALQRERGLVASMRAAVRKVDEVRLRGCVTFLRGAFYDDGAEGESVHRVCADALTLLAAVRNTEAAPATRGTNNEEG